MPTDAGEASASHFRNVGYRRRVTEPHDAPPPTEVAAKGPPDVGRVVDGRYRLAEIIGTGGMATVHRALDTRLGRTVAVKLLRREVIADPDIAMRFRREALAATVLRHPNIVACLETGTDRGQPYLVMELIEGEDLAARLRRVGRLAPTDAERIALDVARALGVAHVRGIVHRDVKPGNILLARDGRAMVTDFGIARLAADSEGAVPGTTLGSVHYFSPEQATGATTTPASDVYSLGLVLYESLTGARAWRGDTTASLAAARVGSAGALAPGRAPGCPRRARRDRASRARPRPHAPVPERQRDRRSARAAGLAAGSRHGDRRSPTRRSWWRHRSRPPPSPHRGPAAAPPLRPAPPSTRVVPAASARRRSGRRATTAVAGPFVVLVAVALVVTGGLLIAALPNPDDPGRIAAGASPRATRAPTPKPTARPTATPDPTPAPAKATPKPDPTAKPQAASVPNLCDPFFGIACGLDRGTYSPAAFAPAIQFKLGDGWAAATNAPDLVSLTRDAGAMTFAGSIGDRLPGRRRRARPDDRPRRSSRASSAPTASPPGSPATRDRQAHRAGRGPGPDRP